MFEVLRFGFAWVAILVLAGLTSVPPEADEFPCCQTIDDPVEKPFHQWISEHFKGYAPSFPLLNATGKAQDKTQNGLCTKSESGSWTRIIGENKPRPNGLFLSIFCETRFHTLQAFGYVSDAETWKDGIKAMDVMTEEVVTGILWTSIKLSEVSFAAWDWGLDKSKQYLPLQWINTLSDIASKFSNMSLSDIWLHVVDFIATNMLELTLADMFLYLWSLKDPTMEISHTCGSMLLAAFNYVQETWLIFANFTMNHSGGWMHLLPLFHSGFGLFTLIPDLAVFCLEASLAAAAKITETVINFEWNEFVALLTESGLSGRALLRRYVLSFYLKTWSEILWDIYAAGIGFFTTLYNLGTVVIESEVTHGIVVTLTELWESYVTLNTLNSIMVAFIASISILNSHFLGPIVGALVLGSSLAKDYLMIPAIEVVTETLSTIIAPVCFRSFEEFSNELQRVAMFLLHATATTFKGANLMATKFGGIHKSGFKDSVDVEVSLLHWSAIYRIAGLVAIGGLVMLIGLFYKYLPGKRHYIRRGKPVRVRQYPGPETMQQVPKTKSFQSLKIFGQYFVAVQRLKTDSDFHCFQMECKASTTPVFLRCLRKDASRKAKIGLAKAYRATKALQHPNIIKFVRWIRTEWVCGLAVEYAPHGHLRSAMVASAVPFKLNQKMFIFRQILTAVMFVHRAGAAHLNIRPGSVLVFEKWKLVKLAGFDHVVKVRQDQICRDYDLHHVAGPTEAIIRQQPYNPYKADAWALGSLLFYIITGDFLHTKTNTPVPAILLPALRECDIRYQKAILGMLTSLLCYDPKGRPELSTVLMALNSLEK